MLLDILIREKPSQQAQGLAIALLRADRPSTNNYQRFVRALMERLLNTGPKAGQELVDVLIERNVPRVWLVDLLLASRAQNTDLQQVIQYVYPDQEMQNKFFLQNATRYLGRETYAESLVKLYKQLLPLRDKLQRLFLLLDSLTDTKLILDALTMTPLDTGELETVLKRYGKNYLQYFRKAPELAHLVVTNFAELINKGYTRSFDLLFTILPSQIEASFLEELLATAQLNSGQQARFLEQYGPTYFAQYAQYTQESVFIDYIDTYVDTLSVESFKEKEVASFFAALASRATQLPLDAKSKERIHSWQVVREYLRAPDARPQTLQQLSNALPHVPNEPNLRAKLRQALFSSIQTSSDISEIVKSMREVPTVEEKKDEEYDFLYQFAELAAENYRSSHNLNVLLPYLAFVLILPPHERSDDFFSSFLNKLLQHIQEDSTPSLRDLDAFIKLQGLPNSAMELWRMYYRKLTKPFWRDEPLITRVFKAFTKPSKEA
jgi:hypothetical protein